MFDFEKPKIEIAEISEDKRYGKFVVEPLERGYGTTLGNSLRRIMLSSLPGAAVSQVKIDGVLHEFSSIPGVKEDVTEIIMNIKSLAIKNSSETMVPAVTPTIAPAAPTSSSMPIRRTYQASGRPTNNFKRASSTWEIAVGVMLPWPWV